MSTIVKYILAARFLELGLRKFHRAVVEFEDSAEFRTWRRDGRVRREHFPCDGGECTPNILGRFTEDGFEFSCRHFAVAYAIDPSLAANRAWHRMRHITQRNGVTARILWLIAERQRAHLRCGDPLELCPYPYEDVIKDHRALWPDRYIDASIVSRIIKNKPVIGFGGKRVLLADLLPGRTQWLGHRIAYLLGHVDPQLSDAGLAAALKAHYGLRISRRYVTHCRRAMGIPPLRDRLGKGISSYPGTLLGGDRCFDEETLAEVTSGPGVYELSLTSRYCVYPRGRSAVVYIGSSMCLRKRLASYLRGHAHSKALRCLIAGEALALRLARSVEHRALESRLIHGFQGKFGALPLLNKVRPKLA